MPFPIKKNREITIQLLYTLDSNTKFIDESIFIFMSIFQVSRRNILEYIKNSQKIYEKKDLIDSYLKNISKEYSIERIAKVDLAILRVLLYEVIFYKLPIEITISEAIRIAKKFSSYGSGKYLHAIIDAVYKEVNNAQKSLL